MGKRARDQSGSGGRNVGSPSRPRRRQDVVDRSADTEHLVLDRRNGQLHRLNATAAVVWGLCDGEHSLVEMVAKVKADFEDVPDDLEEDIQRVIDQLEAKGLLE